MKWTKSDFLSLYDSSSYSDDDVIKFIRAKIKQEAVENNFHIRQMSDDEILSIAYRLVLLIERSHSDLAYVTNTTNRNVKDIVVRKDKESYATIPYGNRKIDITFSDMRNSQLFLDVDNGDIIFRSMNKIINRSLAIDTYGVSSYCFSDPKQLNRVFFPKKDYRIVTEDELENLIICDRFDPVDNTTFNGYLKGKEAIHKNNFGVLEDVKCEEEMGLIKDYYGDVVPVPHFHFGTKSYCVQNRGGQLAISLKNLSRYLKDLADEYNRYCSGESGDFKLLQYDIGIPFFGITTDKLKFDFVNFFVKMRSVLKSLETSVNNKNKDLIREVYDILQYKCFATGSTDPLYFIANVVDCVDELSLVLDPRSQSKIMFALQDSCNKVNQNTQTKSEMIEDRADDYFNR